MTQDNQKVLERSRGIDRNLDGLQDAFTGDQELFIHATSVV